jgi:hypothetical protein
VTISMALIKTLSHDETSLPQTDEEVSWRDELEKIGETQVRQNLLSNSFYTPPKKYFVLNWVREKECARERRDQEIFSYTSRTYWVAVAAVVVGVIGVVATLLLAKHSSG